VLNIKYVFLDQALLHTYGLSRTRRNDETADGTEISKYIGLDSRQLFDNYSKPDGTPLTVAHCSLARPRVIALSRPSLSARRDVNISSV